jgi:hypothetical protein
MNEDVPQNRKHHGKRVFLKKVKNKKKASKQYEKAKKVAMQQ